MYQEQSVKMFVGPDRVNTGKTIAICFAILLVSYRLTEGTKDANGRQLLVQHTQRTALFPSAAAR